MACGSCGGKKQNQAWKLTFRDGTPSRTVETLTEARMLLAKHGGGTKELVAKPAA